MGFSVVCDTFDPSVICIVYNSVDVGIVDMSTICCSVDISVEGCIVDVLFINSTVLPSLEDSIINFVVVTSLKMCEIELESVTFTVEFSIWFTDDVDSDVFMTVIVSPVLGIVFSHETTLNFAKMVNRKHNTNVKLPMVIIHLFHNISDMNYNTAF